MADTILAIVGRPNVGKSTLFNRLVGRKLALVDDTPGVTRDRRMGVAEFGDLRVSVIDTPGLETGADATLAGRMRAQTNAAIAEADAILFLIDARAGVLPADMEFARILRKANTPIILLANKSEGGADLVGYDLGFGAPIAVSAEHGLGIGALFDAVKDALPNLGAETDLEEDAEKALRVAILGRPNAGKSTLVNRLLGAARLLTGAEAGLTRDAIAVDYAWQDATGETYAFKIWDTAGVRRRARVQEKLEKLSVADALRAVRFAEIVVLLIDAQKPFDKQDIQLADLVAREGRGLVIAVNKCDLPHERASLKRAIDDSLVRALPRVAGVPVVFLSAETGAGFKGLMPCILAQYEIWNTRIGTARLNRWLADAVMHHPPPADKGRPVRLRYMTQAKARPPSFVVFSSRGHSVPEHYMRYLENGLRAEFGLDGVPLRLFMRTGENPYR